MNIEATVEVSNAGGTTPNFTAAISNLGQFLEDMRSQLQPAVYVFVYDGEAEAWSPHEPKGITLTIVDDTEDLLAAGDTITVTVGNSEVIVNDPRQRKPGYYHDAVIDGVVYRGLLNCLAYVSDESELADLGDMPVGTIAFAYGLGSAWQLDASGEWVEVGGGE